MRKSRGFTLIEMVVAMAASAIVIGAGMTLVSVCVRTEAAAASEANRQNTARVVITLIEKLAGECELGKPEPTGSAVRLQTLDGKTVVYYDGGETVYVSGDAGSGTPIITGAALSAETDPDRPGVLTVTITYPGGEKYSTSVFCRTWEAEEKVDLDTLPFGENIKEFLQCAYDQYGSHGEIIGGDGTYSYFSEWYHGGFDGEWNENTPWCACFASWCIDRVKDSIDGTPPTYAKVESWVDSLTETDYILPGSSDVKSGDIIFFSWGNEEPVTSLAEAKRTHANHVGIVVKVEEGKIITIEGNSGGVVQQCSYDAESPHIIGYARLSFKGSDGL